MLQVCAPLSVDDDASRSPAVGATLARHHAGTLMVGFALAMLLGLAALGAQARGVPLPLFDAHLHYNDDAQAPYPPEEVLARLRDAGVTAIVATSQPNEGTRARVAGGRMFERGRLFRIDRAGVPASYLYGILHSNDPRATALPGPVVAALGASRSAAFESLLIERDVDEFHAAARYEDRRRLTDHVDAATLLRIRAALGSDAPDSAALERTKPWAVMLMLAQSRDRDSASLDGVLLAEAKARGLGMLALELPEEQTASLDAIPLASQIALLRWTLDTQSSRAAELESTTRAWLAGDLAGLWRMALEPRGRDRALTPHFRALLQHLVTGRNVLMAHRLHLPLAHGRVFVAVGALHLYGGEGLLALIARQGYRVTRVF